MKLSKLIFSKPLFIFGLILIVAFSIVGCGAGDVSTEDQQSNNGNELSEHNSTQYDDKPYIIEHAMGTTEIKGTPERIVVLTNHGTEALLAMGIKPIGAVQSWTGDPWYDHIADQMEGVEVVGLEHQVNVEKIAALQPDLIIGNKMRQEDIYEQLRAIAPTVFEETLRGDWKVNFELIAKAVNKEEIGRKVLSEYEQRIAKFQKQAGDKLSMEVSVVRFMPGDVRIYQKDSFSGIILEEIGFSRPEAQDVNEFAIKGVSKEQVPLMDGDILFYFTYETGDGEGTSIEEEWINDPLFQNLNVAKAGNVYKVSDTIWNTSGGVLAAHLMLDDLEKYFLDNK